MEEKLRKYFENMYGEGIPYSAVIDGVRYEGLRYGNDECFDIDQFYQVVVSGDKAYKFYYDADDAPNNDINNIDYDNPLDIVELDDLDESDLDV